MSPLSLARQAHARIIEMIFSGAIAPGDALQEAKLGDVLEMSRTPVREAIKRIEAEGLAARDGRFLRVRRLTRAEVEEIFFLRGALESYSAGAATSLPAADLDAIEARIRALMDTGPEAGSPGEEEEEGEEHWRVDNAFHRLLAGATGNAVLLRTVDDLRLRTCMFDHTQVPERFRRGCEEHLRILDALRAADGPAAARLMAAHVAGARDAILARIDTLSGQTR
ncbi:GntR family transcriptional regulator [Paroceanicella profunda]|uniref:GntR family transcriptional regulator n=1 Tax=Paroceanicella profunda TaxID=2579971 RepID=A0A5B8FR37_9RHOB|nr:GntR family transcriptional regulator [Paroceanicella profunda]QDL91166.1 GntR family transcriptional regulator [Paroceanicella profunda]